MIIIVITIRVPNTNIGCLKAFKLTIRDLIENCLIENRISDKVPIIKLPIAIDVFSLYPTLPKPYTIPKNPTVDRSIDNK